VIKLSALRPGQTVALVAALAAACAITVAGCGSAPGGGSQSGGSTAGSPGASTTTPASVPTTPSTSPSSPALPSGFAVLSMTFVSDTQGWALGTAPCASGHCLALLGTTDGGAHWQALTAPTKAAGGVFSTCQHGSPCVQQVRFMTPEVGYAFGPSLFLTTDGGHSWQQLPGSNVSSLEGSGGTVSRISSGGTGCAGQPYSVQSAANGSDSWTTLPAPKIEMICPPVLYRQGQRIVVAGYGNPAGGVRATAQIDRSPDGGQTWSSGPDSCGGTDGYASGVALASPFVLVLLCQHQMPLAGGGYAPAWVRVSTNGGATFGPDRTLPAPDASLGTFIRYQIAAGTVHRFFVAETGQYGSQLVETQNAGGTWATHLTMPSTSPVILVGFEDPLTARVAQGDTVWTTRSGGQAWTADKFVP
jgi:photosystem II stability/assembly factor-like uncharacterized protein